MFFYEGYTCPVCGEKFKESDDIVACPECGAPHHRDCWKKEGHCHFVADHGTDRQWVRPQAGDSANSAESAADQVQEQALVQASPYLTRQSVPLPAPTTAAPFEGAFRG